MSTIAQRVRQALEENCVSPGVYSLSANLNECFVTVPAEYVYHIKYILKKDLPWEYINSIIIKPKRI